MNPEKHVKIITNDLTPTQHAYLENGTILYPPKENAQLFEMASGIKT